jgi:hypothetical protein
VAFLSSYIFWSFVRIFFLILYWHSDKKPCVVGTKFGQIHLDTGDPRGIQDFEPTPLWTSYCAAVSVRFDTNLHFIADLFSDLVRTSPFVSKFVRFQTNLPPVGVMGLLELRLRLAPHGDGSSSSPNWIWNRDE